MVYIEHLLCDACGTCISVCPVDAIELRGRILRIDQETCTDCGNCVTVCPVNALAMFNIDTAND